MKEDSSANDGEPKIQRARPTKLIGVHCSAKLVNAIDRFIADQYDTMKRPEAIRKILIESLAERNYFKKESAAWVATASSEPNNN